MQMSDKMSDKFFFLPHCLVNTHSYNTAPFSLLIIIILLRLNDKEKK